MPINLHDKIDSQNLHLTSLCAVYKVLSYSQPPHSCITIWSGDLAINWSGDLAIDLTCNHLVWRSCNRSCNHLVWRSCNRSCNHLVWRSCNHLVWRSCNRDLSSHVAQKRHWSSVPSPNTPFFFKAFYIRSLEVTLFD